MELGVSLLGVVLIALGGVALVTLLVSIFGKYLGITSMLNTMINFVGEFSNIITKIVGWAPSWLKVSFFVLFGIFFIGAFVNWSLSLSYVCSVDDSDENILYEGPFTVTFVAKLLSDELDEFTYSQNNAANLAENGDIIPALEFVGPENPFGLAEASEFSALRYVDIGTNTAGPFANFGYFLKRYQAGQFAELELNNFDDSSYYVFVPVSDARELCNIPEDDSVSSIVNDCPGEYGQELFGYALVYNICYEEGQSYCYMSTFSCAAAGDDEVAEVSYALDSSGDGKVRISSSYKEGGDISVCTEHTSSFKYMLLKKGEQLQSHQLSLWALDFRTDFWSSIFGGGITSRPIGLTKTRSIVYGDTYFIEESQGGYIPGVYVDVFSMADAEDFLERKSQRSGFIESVAGDGLVVARDYSGKGYCDQEDGDCVITRVCEDNGAVGVRVYGLDLFSYSTMIFLIVLSGFLWFLKWLL